MDRESESSEHLKVTSLRSCLGPERSLSSTSLGAKPTGEMGTCLSTDPWKGTLLSPWRPVKVVHNSSHQTTLLLGGSREAGV